MPVHAGKHSLLSEGRLKVAARFICGIMYVEVLKCEF